MKDESPRPRSDANHLREHAAKNARLGGLASGPRHSLEHMGSLGRVGGRAKKPGLQNNRFTAEQARAAQRRSVASRKNKKFVGGLATGHVGLFGVPREEDSADLRGTRG